MAREFVLVNEKGEFVTDSHGFTAEYPDAKLFSSRLSARVTAKDLVFRDKAVSIDIVEHYGYDNEWVVESFKKTEGKVRCY